MIIENRKWLLLISIPSIAIILFIIIFSIFESPIYKAPWMQPGRPPMLSVYILPVSTVVMIFAILPLSYYFISKRLGERLEKNMKVISRLISKNNNKNNIKYDKKPSGMNTKDIIMRFLSPSERKVLQKLVEGKGIVLQSEISRMEGMNKLKTHRIIRDMEMKGVIKTENYGKTKRIILSKDIKDSLK